MQGRSWMAALTLVAASVGALALSTARAGDPTPIKQKVKLFLRLDGIVAEEGAELIIKPGHPGCRFKPITRQVKKGIFKVEDIPPIDVECFSADRDCSFAITLKEPGQAEKTVRRNIQIVPADEPQALTCYVSSKSLSAPVAKSDEATRKK